MTTPSHHRSDSEGRPPAHSRRKAAWPMIRPVSIDSPQVRWVDQARCHGKWSTFDPLDHGATDAERTEQLAEARRICATCPVAVPCDQYARSARPAVVGIWSGRRRFPNSKERSKTA